VIEQADQVKSAMNGGPAAFQVLGTFLAGTLGEKIGRRGITMVSYAILSVGITIEFIANRTPNPIAVFFAG
jgi:MFS family permease